MRFITQNFSIREAFLVVTIAALMCAVWVQHKRIYQDARAINQLESELDYSRPIPFNEVAKQFKKAMASKIKVEVTRVRYDPSQSIYFVTFGWKDANLNELIGYTVQLVSEGNGRFSTVLYDNFGNMNSIVEPLKITVQSMTMSRRSNASIQEDR